MYRTGSTVGGLGYGHESIECMCLVSNEALVAGMRILPMNQSRYGRIAPLTNVF